MNRKNVLQTVQAKHSAYSFLNNKLTKNKFKTNYSGKSIKKIKV